MPSATNPDDDTAERMTRAGFERVLSVQRPVVLAHLRLIRRQKPGASPAEVATILEKRFLAAVTAGGAAVGAVAVLPGVGTAGALAISGAETVGFLEASALYAQSIAELHGVAMEDPERSSSLVMALMLGSVGGELVKQFAGEAAGTAPARSAYWGELVTRGIPKRLVGSLTSRIRRSFIQRFAAKQGAHIVLRVVPFGIGAVVGGTGNHMLGRKIIRSSHDAFGPAPTTFPDVMAIAPTGAKALESESAEAHADQP